MKNDVNHSCIERTAKLAYSRYPYFKSRFKTIDVMLFIKTLMYYYLNFKYPYNNVRIPDVRLVGEGMLPGETADPIKDGNLEFDRTKVYVADRTAFAIPEVYLPYGTAEQEMDMTALGTHFRSLIAKQKETDSARCSASVMKMMFVGETFTIDFQQNFPDKTYAEAFLTEALKMGLTARCSDVIAYVTPEDHTANTNFLKSLVEFFRRILY